MSESVILNNPLILAGFTVALLLFAAAIIKKTHFAVSLIAVAVFSATMCYALLEGTELYEAGAAAALFAVVGMIPLWVKKEK